MTTWRAKLTEAMRAAKDAGPVLAAAGDLDKEFYAGFGSAEGPEVLIWTQTRVYFPVTYDGAESLGSAPRDPQSAGQRHVGGE